MTVISVLIIVLCFFVILSLYLILKIPELRNRNLELLETLICVMEAGDPNLDGHSMHVCNIVSVFYEYLPGEYQRNIRPDDLKYAALLHDIGKLGIPREIYTKEGQLTRDEMLMIRNHPEICVDIIEPIDFLSRIKDVILYHHERVDGCGYHSLSSEKIPLASKMIAIADTYSALTMDRTYKPSMPYEEAIVELKQVAGTQLDAKMVECFCNIPKYRLDDCISKVHKITDRYREKHIGEYNR